MNDFSQLALRPELIASAQARGFAQMTAIQAQALPAILDGQDVLAQAATGSGKTAAFGFGLLNALAVDQAACQALVLCPTRELADQVSQSLRLFAATIPNIKLLTLCGGAPMRAQLNSLSRAPQIVVGTPGRVLAHLKRGSLSTTALSTFVLDEADRMLDMGFIDDIDAIMSYLPARRQTLLFSATWPDGVRSVSNRLQQDAAEVMVGAAGGNAPRIFQTFHKVSGDAKLAALEQVLASSSSGNGGFAQALVFCNQRAEVERVAEYLNRRGLAALALHGDREQRDRDEVLLRFVNQSCGVLVATDVAARGLDIEALPLVVSYDLARDIGTHTHRIGRTGRAGEAGRAVALCTDREVHRAERITVASGIVLSWSRLSQNKRPTPARPPMTTLLIQGGRRDKLRPGDILGALTGQGGLSGEDVGRIDIMPTRAYVAISRPEINRARERLKQAGIKGRRFRLAVLDGG